MCSGNCTNNSLSPMIVRNTGSAACSTLAGCSEVAFQYAVGADQAGPALALRRHQDARFAGARPLRLNVGELREDLAFELRQETGIAPVNDFRLIIGVE